MTVSLLTISGLQRKTRVQKFTVKQDDFEKKTEEEKEDENAVEEIETGEPEDEQETNSYTALQYEQSLESLGNDFGVDTEKKTVKRGRLVSISRRGMRPSVASPLTDVISVERPPSRETIPLKVARHRSIASPIDLLNPPNYTQESTKDNNIKSDLKSLFPGSKSTDTSDSKHFISSDSSEEMKVLSFDEYGDLVELTSPPRLTYVFSHPLKDPAYMQRERLLNYRESRLAINKSNARLQNEHRESMEEYLERTVFNNKIYVETMHNNYKHRYRDTRYTAASSYAPWTVDIDNLPTLCRYVWKGRSGKMQHYLNDSSNWKKVNKHDNQQRTPLHFAASWGCVELVEMLLKIKDVIDVNKQDSNGMTPLHKAAERGSFVCVKRLLNAGANPSIRSDGRNVLETIVNRKGDKALDVITFLYHNMKKMEGSTNGNALTLLQQAVLAQPDVPIKHVIRMLVDEGEDINAVEKNLRTPLMMAVIRERHDVVKLLVKHKANARCVDVYGKTAEQYTEVNSEIQLTLQRYVEEQDDSYLIDISDDDEDVRKSNDHERPSFGKKV